MGGVEGVGVVRGANISKKAEDGVPGNSSGGGGVGNSSRSIGGTALEDVKKLLRVVNGDPGELEVEVEITSDNGKSLGRGRESMSNAA